MSIFLKNLNEHNELMGKLISLNSVVIKVGQIAAEKIKEGGKIILCGNGGSAADSQHIAAELTGRFINDRRPLAALSLTTDTSALTCIANDYSFDEIFSRQLVALGRRDDVFVGISTSGNSKNIIHAIQQAKALGITTVGLIGKDGGQMKSLCDYSILVPSDVTARIQEAHILIGHTLCGLIEENLNLV